MNVCKLLNDKSKKVSVLVFIVLWLLSGCSDSNESVLDDTQPSIEDSTSSSSSDNVTDSPTDMPNTNTNGNDNDELTNDTDTDSTINMSNTDGNDEPTNDTGTDSPNNTPNTDGNEEDNELTNTTDEDVVDSGNEPTVDNSYALNDVAQGLMLSLAGYQADQLAPLVDELTASVIAGLEGDSLESTEIFVFDAQSETTVTEPVTRVSYNCAGGGTVIWETGSATFVNANLLRSKRLDGYVFDQCIHDSSGITLPNDNYTINGSLNLSESRFFTSGYSSASYAYAWEGFSLQAAGAASYELEGIVNTSTTSSSSGNSSMRTAVIDLYRKTEAQEVVVSIDGGVFELTRLSNGGASIQNYDVNVDGSISGLDTNGQTVEITTTTILSRQRGVGFSVDSNIPFSGQVEFLSEDGSFLYLTGNPTAVSSTDELDVLPDFVTLNLIDLAYTSATGEQVESIGVALNAFTVKAPNCDIVRNDATGSIECGGDESLVLP